MTEEEEFYNVELIGSKGSHKRVRVDANEQVHVILNSDMPNEKVRMLLPLPQDHMRTYIWNWIHEQMDAKSDTASQGISFRDTPEGELFHYKLTMERIEK